MMMLIKARDSNTLNIIKDKLRIMTYTNSLS